MTTSPAREPSEWDDDPAWSRPDPMTAEEREAWLDHLAETDEPPEEEQDWADFGPLTAAELAEARDGAADDALELGAKGYTAYRTVAPYPPVDHEIDVAIQTRPFPSTLVNFTACLRGPGLTRAEQSVDALLASMKLVSQ